MTIDEGPAAGLAGEYPNRVDSTHAHVPKVASAKAADHVAATTWRVDSHEIDHVRPMKVIVIGAGISGILAAIRFPRRIANVDLVVYDKNPEIGGTWYENKYPGVACGMYLIEVPFFFK